MKKIIGIAIIMICLSLLLYGCGETDGEHQNRLELTFKKYVGRSPCNEYEFNEFLKDWDRIYKATDTSSDFDIAMLNLGNTKYSNCYSGNNYRANSQIIENDNSNLNRNTRVYIING